jgi:membrane protein DedA with SNARE-associated domain
MTAIGACAWNVFLAWLGYGLGERWEALGHIGRWLDVAVVAALLSGVAWWWRRRRSTLAR